MAARNELGTIVVIFDCDDSASFPLSLTADDESPAFNLCFPSAALRQRVLGTHVSVSVLFDREITTPATTPITCTASICSMSTVSKAR